MYNIRDDKTLSQQSFSFLNLIGHTPPLVLPAGNTTKASLNIPHGAAPTSPVNGDIWTTTAGLFVRVNGVTIGPLIA